jgi:hypothetical protein
MSDEGTRAPERRRNSGVLFWVAMAAMAVAIPASLIVGDFLWAAAYCALAMHLILDRAGLRERSAGWRWADNAAAATFCVLVLIFFLAEFGVL